MALEAQGLTKEQKEALHEELDRLIERVAEMLHLEPEIVATQLFYRLQRHPQYGRNATTAQKNAAFQHWKGICQKCDLEVERTMATFHHLKRGIKNQHRPENLVPYHPHCHDGQHGAIDGSLLKGSPERRKPKPSVLASLHDSQPHHSRRQ